jgi:ketosteroid isomerase-like protein
VDPNQTPLGSETISDQLLKGGIMRIVSTSDVLDRHLKSFAEYDLDGVLADYSSDAVLFVPTGPLKGPDAIKPLFQALVSEFAKPGSSFTMQQRCIEGDHAYILWTAETADNSYEFATDTFVVRNGKIVAQSFAAKVKPKR